MFGIPKSFLIFVSLLIILIVLVIFIKSSVFRIFVVSVIYVAFLIFSFYAYLQVDKYFSASGGIFGEIGLIEKPNSVKRTQMRFNFTNLMLTATGETDVYSLIIENAEALDLTSDYEYMLSINETPTQTINKENNYIEANYTYKFYDENKNSFVDTLNIKISFFTNSTTIIIKTCGGKKAVEYWDYYFNKNNFIIEINPIDVDTPIYNDNYMGFEDLKSKFQCVYFYDLNRQVINHSDYELGVNNIYVPNIPIVNGYDGYWSLDGKVPFDFDNLSISKDISYNFKPIYIAKTYTATFYDVDGTTLLGTCKFEAGTKLSNLQLDFDYSKNDGGVYKWTPLNNDNVSLSSDGQTYILNGNCSFVLSKIGGIY